MYTEMDVYAVFREEAVELIDEFGQLAESLLTAATEERSAILGNLLRTVHNLKGAARTVDLGGMEALTHRIEEDLEPFKADPGALSEQQIAKLVKATAALQMLLEENEAAAPDKAAAPGEAVPKKKGAATENRPQEFNGIRVDAARLDGLMGFSGELLMSKARMEVRHRRLASLAQLIERKAQKGTSGEDGLGDVVREIRELMQTDVRDLMDFGYLTDGITEAMKKVRMVPLRLAEREWREVVRKVSLTAGKEVVTAVRTGTIELDKQVLDQLRDPMTHLLRNAVDHGLESPEERAAKGKSPVGKIEITASVQGAMVQIEVRDDGGGVDRERIRKVAASSNIVASDRVAAMSEEELINLLFQPGFSTASEVSTLSGRGVGLDVVRGRIEALGGSVRLSPRDDRNGTDVCISVPLSILSRVGLHVGSGTTTYSFPLEYVVRTTRAREQDIEKMDGQRVLKQEDGDPIRLVRLSELLGHGEKSAGNPDKVVVLSRSNQLLGVLVERIEGHFEFISQSLPWNLERAPGVNGVSPRPDGSVIVDIDVPYLFEKAGGSALGYRSGSFSGAPGNVSRTRRVLVVDDSAAARTMAKNILLDAGYVVESAADGEVAWQLLKQHSFDLLVSDINMPKLDGLALTRRVRATAELRDLPIVLVTSLDKPEDKLAGAEAGADEYIVKGAFDQNSLLETVSKYL